jgi:acyl dehydratase
MDHEFAKTTHFRRPIAHGILVLALASGLGINCPMMRTLAFLSIRDWQLKEPVYVGDTLRVRTRILNKEARGRGRRGVITWHRQIVNQEQRVVQEGVIVTMVEGRGPKRDPEPDGTARAPRENSP